MARKGKGRKNFSRYINGSFDLDMPLTTLGSKVVAKQDFSETVADTTRVSSVKATYSISDFTPGANIGPIAVGLAHSDYTAAEIEEWIEQAGSWDIGNLQTKEVRSRRIRQVGVFDDPSAVQISNRLNDGRLIHTKLNWLLAEGDTVAVWCYNLGTAAVATTVPNVNVIGKANLWQV